jgi:hypothetical protein
LSIYELFKGGGLVGFLKNVDNTVFALLVYSLHSVLCGNQHLHEYMKIYNLHIKNKQIYNSENVIKYEIKGP